MSFTLNIKNPADLDRLIPFVQDRENYLVLWERNHVWDLTHYSFHYQSCGCGGSHEYEFEDGSQDTFEFEVWKKQEDIQITREIVYDK